MYRFALALQAEIGTGHPDEVAAMGGDIAPLPVTSGLTGQNTLTDDVQIEFNIPPRDPQSLKSFPGQGDHLVKQQPFHLPAPVSEPGDPGAQAMHRRQIKIVAGLGEGQQGFMAQGFGQSIV